NGPDGTDRAIVEDARPGLGKQDLRFQSQPIEGISEPAVEHARPVLVGLDLVQRGHQLRHPGRAYGLSSAEAGKKRVGFMIAWSHVGQDGLEGCSIHHFWYD